MTKKTYHFPLERFITEQQFEHVKNFSKDIETPFLVINLEAIKLKYAELKTHLPFTNIYYAVKANPHPEVLSCLRDLGSNFDVASRYELDLLLELGVDPEKLSYGNTIKKARDIAYFYEKGIRLYVCDSEEDLQNLAQYAPNSDVFFRIISEGTGADWPLSRKFGAHSDVIYNLILHAKNLNLNPIGLSFHVGSQQHDIGQWDDAIARCKYLFDAVKEEGIHLKMINMGGGFPSNYLHPTQPIDVYAQEITRFLHDDFGDELPQILIEPGRSLVGDSGIIVTEVIQISKKALNNMYRWVYLDIGLFTGLIETIGEAIKYPIFFDGEGASEEVIIAGPTCDSIDILYEDYKYKMPESMKAGDRVYFFTTGAYTQSYSSVCFNGFPPLKSYVL
jgi:ornithine decarboxylase